MKKKILTLALAGALVLSANSVAYAADTEITAPTDGAYSSSINVSADVKVPTIKITLSDTSSKKVGLNPYGLKYEVVPDTEVTDAIANVEETITNESNVAISVNATTKATTKGDDVILATSMLKGTETTKSVFAYLELEGGKENADTPVLTTSTYDSKAANQLVFGAKATTKTNMVTLAAGDSAATYAGYKIFGGVASKPAKAWAETDGLDLNITFSFEPVIASAS